MSDTADPLHVFEWAPATAGLAATREGADALAERLASLADDRGRAAADLVRRIARETHAWLSGATSPDERVSDHLAAELAAVVDGHGWRAPLRRFLTSLALAAERVPGDAPAHACREALADECSRWFDESLDPDGPVRLGSKERCAAPLLEGPLGVTEGETILVHGWSETVARGLELARARGLRPSAIVSEGGADLGGRRLARRLVAGGIGVTFIYDAALTSAVERVDRVWFGSDAIGAETLLARVGTRAALERAVELDVETAVLATVDKFTADERPAPPAWADSEPWHLWEGAPAEVRVESQSFEAVPLDLVRCFATDAGAFTPAQVRARAWDVGVPAGPGVGS